MDDIKDVYILVIRGERPLEINVQPLKWFSCLDKVTSVWLMVPGLALVTDLAGISHPFDFFN